MENVFKELAVMIDPTDKRTPYLTGSPRGIPPSWYPWIIPKKTLCSSTDGSLDRFVNIDSLSSSLKQANDIVIHDREYVAAIANRSDE
jgi:hypothetical protein